MGYNLPKPTISNLGLKFILRGIEQDWYEFASNSLKLLHQQSLVKIQGGGWYSLQWPIQGGSTRKGYLFQASGI